MKLLVDYFPLIVFVGIYFYSGVEQPMYPAVQGLIVASLIQTVVARLLTGKFEKLHLWILGLTLVLGGMTLLFRDPLFVQWKASVVAWVTALFLLYRQLLSKKPLIQGMMQNALEEDGATFEVPDPTWKAINYSWPVGYGLFGFLNLYVAFNFSEAFWVKFKLFGLLAMTVLLLAFTIYKLFPYIPKDEDVTEEKEAADTASPSTTDNKE